MSENMTFILFITFMFVSSLGVAVYATKNDIKIKSVFNQQCSQLGGVVVASYTCIDKNAILKIR